MSKVLMVDLERDAQDRAENIFQTVIELTKKHGVCFLRFTTADGMVIIEPRYNSKINGVIADA